MDASRGMLADVVPGPELAVMLADVDRSTLDSKEQEDLLRARSRLLAWLQGELLDDVYMVARDVLTDPAERKQAKDDEDRLDLVSAQLVGWMLHWSRSYAYGEVLLSRALTERLPAVRAALRAGRIDAAKAAAIANALSGVDDDEVARRIADKVLRNAPRWTLSQLRDSLRYHVDRADPANARRRYSKRVAGRNVYLTAQPDGTANLAGVDLPPHRAAQAYDRLDRLARTARASGDVRNLGQLRADALVDIVAGIPFQLAPTVDPVSTQADAEARAQERPVRVWGPNWGIPQDPRWPGRDRNAGRDDPWPRGLTPPDEEEPTGRIDLYDYDRLCLTDEDLAWINHEFEPCGAAGDEQDDPPWWTTATPAPPRTPSVGDDSRFQTGNPTTPAPARPNTSSAGDDSRSQNGNPATPSAPPRIRQESTESCFRTGNPAGTDSGPDRDGVLCPDVLAGDRCVCGGLLPDLRPGALDMQVKLSTVAGLDEHPALIPGLGPVLADLARQTAFDPIANPVWTWSIFDHAGDLLHHGTTRHRPSRSGAQSRFGTGKTEPRCTCPRIQPSARRGSIDLQLTPTTLNRLLKEPPAGWQTLITDIATQAAADAAKNPPGTWTQTDHDGRLLHHGHLGRMPDATEDAFIRTRDRTCRAPGCTIPASRADIDHRIPRAAGGPSHRGNSHSLCHLHHLAFRHRTGFTVTKQGSTTIWTVPNGLTFPVPIDDDIILTHDDDDQET